MKKLRIVETRSVHRPRNGRAQDGAHRRVNVIETPRLPWKSCVMYVMYWWMRLDEAQYK